LYSLPYFTPVQKTSSNFDRSGLTLQEIDKLSKSFPGLKFDFTKERSTEQLNLKSYNDYYKYLLSIKNQLFENAGKAVNVNVYMISAFPDNQVQGKITGCDYGSYYAYAGSAGNLSDFRATFKYSSSGISDLNISTTGVRIGWEIADQSTYYIAGQNGAFSGCTTIIANFF